MNNAGCPSSNSRRSRRSGVRRSKSIPRFGPLWGKSRLSSAAAATADEDSAHAPIADLPGAEAISSDENEPAAIIFTLGTEERAKAAVLAHRALLANQQMLLPVACRLPYRPDATAGEVYLH